MAMRNAASRSEKAKAERAAMAEGMAMAEGQAMAEERVTFVAAVNDRQVLRENLLRSPALAAGHGHQLMIKEGFRSAALAYNSAIEEADNDLMVFVHQDVYLPKPWLTNLMRSIRMLDAVGVRWGVLGSFGAGKHGAGGLGCVYSNGWGLQGLAVRAPEQVETLDEIVLVTRKSAGLRFDPHLPHFHMYGVDLCLTARSRGLESCVIPAFCIHNTRQLLVLPDEFYQCYRYVKRKWRHYLPIATSCIRISTFDLELRRRALEALLDRARGRRQTPRARMADPTTALCDAAVRRQLQFLPPPPLHPEAP
jgi:hypothetical protein